ncbi:hypothetical protein ACIUYZ_31345 [Pseudomonas aeruginosa]
MTWNKAAAVLPPAQNVKKERRRYMVYGPKCGGYTFRCWYRDGFGCDSVQMMISDVTHWRIARRGEKNGQLSADDLAAIAALN